VLFDPADHSGMSFFFSRTSSCGSALSTASAHQHQPRGTTVCLNWRKVTPVDNVSNQTLSHGFLIWSCILIIGISENSVKGEKVGLQISDRLNPPTSLPFFFVMTHHIM